MLPYVAAYISTHERFIVYSAFVPEREDDISYIYHTIHTSHINVSYIRPRKRRVVEDPLFFCVWAFRLVSNI